MANVWSRHADLLAEVDKIFGEIVTRHGPDIECRAGCSDCCRCRLSVPHVEAEYFARGVAALAPQVREQLRRQAKDPDREMCPALGENGNCQLYEWRPSICRSHGVPLRYRARVPAVQEDVIDVCDKNFVGVALRTLPTADSMDQSALTERLIVINNAYCADRNLDPEERVPLAQLLRHRNA